MGTFTYSMRYLIMQKKTHAKFGVTLLVASMLALVGVGFALAYTGSATNSNNDTSGELITVELSSYTEFLSGDYTVDTSNNGTAITLSNLEKDGSAATPYTAKYFAYDAGEFSVVNTDSGYSAALVGTITVTLRQPTTATATDVDLTITGAPASAVNQYGMSLVYVMDDAVFDTSDGIQDIDMSSGEQSFTINAYVVYSNSVPSASIASIGVYSLSAPTITFTASAATA